MNAVSQNRSCKAGRHASFGATSRLEPRPSSATSGCRNTIRRCRSLTSDPTSTAHGSQTSCGAPWARWQATSTSCWCRICPQEDASCAGRDTPSAAPCHSLCWYSRWLMRSVVPGATQLFRTLLTGGDNPVKAVKAHVPRGRKRQRGYVQGLAGSVNV